MTSADAVYDVLRVQKDSGKLRNLPAGGLTRQHRREWNRILWDRVARLNVEGLPGWMRT